MPDFPELVTISKPDQATCVHSAGLYEGGALHTAVGAVSHNAAVEGVWTCARSSCS